jgi:hypothetical protein
VTGLPGYEMRPGKPTLGRHIELSIALLRMPAFFIGFIADRLFKSAEKFVYYPTKS